MKSRNSPQIVPTDSVQEFAALVQSGIDSWTRAGELLVRMAENDHGIYSKIAKAHPSITISMLHAFERIGMKKTYAPLLADASAAGRALMELSFDEQKKYFHEPMEVVISVRGGSNVTKKKRLDELSKHEVRMVFGSGRLHTIDEQAWRFKEIEAVEIQKEKPPAAFVDYKTVEVGYYVITLNESGEPTIRRAPASMPNAHSIRLIPFDGGEKSAVILFYRTPREPRVAHPTP